MYFLCCRRLIHRHFCFELFTHAWYQFSCTKYVGGSIKGVGFFFGGVIFVSLYLHTDKMKEAMCILIFIRSLHESMRDWGRERGAGGETIILNAWRLFWVTDFQNGATTDAQFWVRPSSPCSCGMSISVDVIFVLQSSITWMNKNPSPEKRLFFCFENFSYMFDQGPGTYILSIYINIF